jgi:hypothetical protein
VLLPPAFDYVETFDKAFGDRGFWDPYFDQVIRRHDLPDPTGEVTVGVGGTYPTLVYGGLVIKLFGFAKAWKTSIVAERAAHELLADDPDIAAPQLVSMGVLFPDEASSWPYLVTTRVPGTPWELTSMTTKERLQVATELGLQLRRIHALRPHGHESTLTAPGPGISEAAAQSCLSPHLVEQVDDFMRTLDTYGRVFVHGDLVQLHAFVDNGRLAGIIDWGDAVVTDPHYELGKLAFELFDCDKQLLSVFLDASQWVRGPEFARQALGLALQRQAVGLTQHHTFDVFEPVGDHYPLCDIATLDELAAELFNV